MLSVRQKSAYTQQGCERRREKALDCNPSFYHGHLSGDQPCALHKHEQYAPKADSVKFEGLQVADAGSLVADVALYPK